MHARLTLYFRDAPARRVYLDPLRRYDVGRGAGCDVVIDNSQMSRRHALLHFEHKHWVLKDLGSKNGVAVDGEAVAEAHLDEQCFISFGELLARFETRSEEQAQAEALNQRRRYETSLQLRRSLRPADGAESVLRKVLESVMQLASMRRGFAMLARTDGELEIGATAGVQGVDAFLGSRGAIDHALQTQRSVVSMDVQQFAPLADRPSIVAGDIRALICLPMSLADRTIGAVYADTTETGKVLTDLDLEILEGLISHATTTLALAQIDQELVDLGSLLRDGELDTESVRDLIPAYGQPVPGTAMIKRAPSGVTWSSVFSKG